MASLTFHHSRCLARKFKPGGAIAVSRMGLLDKGSALRAGPAHHNTETEIERLARSLHIITGRE